MERRSGHRFAASEIARMQNLLADRKEQVLNPNFCQKLTEEFNLSPGRVGSRVLQVTQVQRWFLDKLPTSEEKALALQKVLVSGKNAPATEEKALALKGEILAPDKNAPASEEKVLAFDTSLSNNEDEVALDFPKEQRDKIPEISELEFEARSARDSAWYDVDIFWHTGQQILEVRVRFQGFGAEEDEWVNVKKAVRERSIPLESSECRNVVKGDLVLCFREDNDEALHFDAHVIEIQRKQHDIRGCRCVFLIKYDHDQSQERVNLKRLCRRPKYF